MWCVYKHTAPNGKVYIGITSREPEKRWGHGANYKRQNKHFWNAIQKYGWENIVHEVLFTGLSEEEAQEKEKELITLHDATNPDKGYNLTFGGESFKFPERVKEKMRGPRLLSEGQREELAKRGRITYEKYLKGRKPTEEQIRKMSEAKKGKKQTAEVIAKRTKGIRRYYKTHRVSDETRRRLSEANKGKRRTPETIEKIRLTHTPELNGRSKPVLQIKDGEVIARYCSAREAERRTRINYASIVRVCNGVRLKHAGGFEWEYVKEPKPSQVGLFDQERGTGGQTVLELPARETKSGQLMLIC